MIVKCKDCGFRYESRKQTIKDLIKEKEEHATLMGHNVVYMLTLGTKVIEKTTPTSIYSCFCNMCWDSYGKLVRYETISRMDADRFQQVHNDGKAKKEGKLYEYHAFSINETPFSKLLDEVRSDSQIIQKMEEQELTPADINFTEKRVETGDQELAFFITGGSRLETYLAYFIYKNSCPICRFVAITGEDYLNPNIRELLDRKYDILLSHMRKYHPENDENNNITVNILQMCIIYQRNITDQHAPPNIREIRYNKRSQALRSLNKTGVAMSLLTAMFDSNNHQVGCQTYRGMEILGKPEWVQRVENA